MGLGGFREIEEQFLVRVLLELPAHVRQALF